MGNLTERTSDAQSSEAQALGRTLDRPEPEIGAAVRSDVNFPPDEFERNPYQAPRNSAEGPSSWERFGSRDVLWFIYAGLVGLLTVGAAVFDPNPTGVATLFEATATVCGPVGIIAWRLRRALFAPPAWIAWLAVVVSWHALQTWDFWNDLSDDADDAPPLLVAALVFVFALHVPLFWGVLRYALFSPSIWHKRTPAANGQ